MHGVDPGSRDVAVTISTAERQVTLAVEDAGPPLDEAAFGRFFTPLYTTKPQGLGMGLAIGRAIVEAHGGRLWAERRRAGGLIMRVALPRLDESGVSPRS